MLVVAATLLVLFASSSASASVKLSGTIQRTHENPGGPFWINQADCLSQDDLFSFPFAVTPVDGSQVLEIWTSESTSCALNTARNGPSPTCRRIMSTPVTKAPIQVSVRSRELATALSNVDADCTDTSGQELPRALHVFALLLSTPTEDVAPEDVIDLMQSEPSLRIDLVPPPPPDTVQVSPAPEALSVFIQYTEAPAQDTSVYRIYCDPPPTPPSVPGDSCTSQLDPEVCDSCVLQQGSAALSSEHQCGAISFESTSGSAVVLAPGRTYAVAVTAVDRAGNTSVLSVLACGGPVLPGFRSEETDAGGCALAPAPLSSSSGQAMIGLVTALGLVFRRRRRQPFLRNRPSSSDSTPPGGAVSPRSSLSRIFFQIGGNTRL